MNIHCKPILTSLILGLTALPSMAQKVPGTTAVTTPDTPVVPITGSSASAVAEAASEVVEMSPFVVSSERNTGYQALNTLAGTRLNTPLKDIGASISIYTNDLMDDIVATDATTLLAYTTNMEVTGANGNFSNGNNDTASLNGGQREQPQGASRARGLATPNFTRNYFSTNIAFDTYNTGPVTIARGPNAILFGVGSPAGVVDTSLVTADTRKTKTKAVVRFGNNDSLRLSLDHNQVLLRQKLALRVAALDDDEKYNQRPAFEHKKRVFGTLTFTPTRTTEIRANFESGKTTANRPIAILPMNSIASDWWDMPVSPDGKSGEKTFDWSYYDDPARNPSAASQAPGGTYYGNLMGVQLVNANQMLMIYDDPAGAPSSVWRVSLPRATGNPATANAVHDTLYHPALNRDQRFDQATWLSTRNLYELPAAYWTADILAKMGLTGQQQPGVQPAGIRYQGFTNYDVFDFANHMIDETGRQNDRFHTANITLSQTAWKDRLGIELAYDRQSLSLDIRNPYFHGSLGSHVRIDTTVTLSDGTPNPNLGRPYVGNRGNASTYADTDWDREGWRATAFARFDFKDLSTRLGRWLGRHTLTGVFQRDSLDTANNQWHYAADGAFASLPNVVTTTNLNDATRAAGTVIYLGPSVLDGSPLRLSPVRIAPLAAGPQGVDISYFVREAGATDPGHFESTPYLHTRATNGGSLSREVIDSMAFSLHSYWLDEHLVTTAGLRWDRDYFANKNIAYDAASPGREWSVDDMGWNRVPDLKDKGRTSTIGVVLRWPQKWLRLPGGSDFSVFYNRSDNFTPSGSRVDGYGRSLDSPEGRTEEFGVQLWGFKDKVSLRLNHYKTQIIGQSYTTNLLNIAINSNVVNFIENWTKEENINPQLKDLRAQHIATLLSVLPGNYLDLYNWSVIGTAPNISVNRSAGITGVTDTTDYTARGYELDLVINPVRGLRIMANVAMQDTTLSNIAPFLKQFIASVAPAWEALKDVPYSNYPYQSDGVTPWQPDTPLSELPPTATTVGQYVGNNLLIPFSALLDSEGKASYEQRRWRANLVVSYAFGGQGLRFLKGASIGAAVRWQDRAILGYETTRGADNQAHVNIDRPFYAPAQTNVDAWVAYEKKFNRNRYSWKIQINVRNLVRDSSPIPVAVQPWGEVSSARIAPERRWYCTNTFSF